MLGVRDGHATADAGGTEQLPLQDCLDDVLGLATLEIARIPQAVHHLADHPLLGAGLELGDDRLADHKIRHAHASSLLSATPNRSGRVPGRAGRRTYSSPDSGVGAPVASPI